jgi:hypothetical protein
MFSCVILFILDLSDVFDRILTDPIGFHIEIYWILLVPFGAKKL